MREDHGTIAALRQENELLRAENHALRRHMGMSEDSAFIARCERLFRARTAEVRILKALMTGRVMSRDALFLAYAGDKIDPPEIKVIDVQLCRLRQRLAPLGVEIETVHSRGWRMRPDAIDLMQRLIDGEADAA